MVSSSRAFPRGSGKDVTTPNHGDVPLREFVEAKIHALDRRLSEQLSMNREAVVTALAAAKESTALALISAETLVKEQDKRNAAALAANALAVEVAMRSAKEAVEKAEASNERRLGLLNEFRAQAADESSKYALSVVVNQTIKGLERRLDAAEQGVAALQGRALAIAGVSALVGGAVVGTIVKALGG